MCRNVSSAFLVILDDENSSSYHWLTISSIFTISFKKTCFSVVLTLIYISKPNCPTYFLGDNKTELLQGPMG